MKHHPEENNSIENGTNVELTKNQPSLNKEDMVELDEWGSFMDIERDGDSSAKKTDSDKVELYLQKEGETSSNSSVEKSIVDDNKENTTKLQSEKAMSEEVELFHDDDKEDDDELSFLERAKKKKERLLHERQRKTYIFLKTGTNWLSFLPLILLIVCLPWVSYVISPDSTLKIFQKWSGDTPSDYLLYQKSLWLLISLPIFALLGFFYQRKMERKRDIILRVEFLCLIGYIILMLISTVVSRYTSTALWGAEEQREGIFVLIGYVILCFSAVSLYRKEKDYRVVFWSLSILVGILTVFLVTSAIEYDFSHFELLQAWRENPALNDLSSEKVQSMDLFALTLQHTELGTLCALLLPFFTVMAIFRKERTIRFVSIVMTICSCILLFFSASKSGLAGLVVAILVFLVTSVRKVIKHYKQTLGVIAAFTVFCAGAAIATNGDVFLKGAELRDDFYNLFKNQNNVDFHDDIPIRKVSVDGKRVFFILQQEVLEVDNTTPAVNCFDETGQYIEFQKEDTDRYVTKDSRFTDYSFTTEYIGTMDQGKVEKRKIMRLYYQNKPIFIINLAGLPQKAFLDTEYKNLDVMEAPFFGFEGKEKFANNRGYVWSRTIPLLKDRIWIGSGAGSFSKEFPQGDVLAKWYVYGTPNVTIDKANSWYLQTGVEQGLLALLLCIIVFLFYFVESVTLYIFRKEYNITETFGLAIFIGLVGYSADTFFVSTSISVAPLFWCLFGFGLGANYWVRRIREQNVSE